MTSHFSLFIEKHLLVVQSLILSLMIINSNIHLPCLPEIQNFYSTSEHVVQIAFIFNPFIALLFSLAFGTAADYYSRKSTLLCSLIIFGIGTILIINSCTIYQFYIGRFLQSLGDGGAALTSGIIIGDYYKGFRYAKIQSILSIVLSLIWASSPLLGEWIFTFFGWKGNFIFILLSIFVPTFILFFWQEKKRPRNLATGVIYSLKDINKRIASKLTPFFLTLAVVQALTLGTFTAFEFMIPFIYHDLYGFLVKETSFVFFIFILINVVSSFIYLYTIRFIRLKRTIEIGGCFLILYLLFGLLFFSFYWSESELHAYFVFGLLSFSLPFILISCSTKIIDSSPQDLGITLSLLTIIRNAGTTGIPLISCLLSYNNFSSFFNVTLFFIIISLLLLVIIKRVY